MFDPARFVTDSSRLPIEKCEWGTLQWLSNGLISPGAEQTLGICRIDPGGRNPRHYHPNCEEVLYMISGIGKHSFEDDEIELHPGMTIRIPVGVTHNMTNAGTDPLVCLIAFNTGRRETVFLE